jgi:hypothetical protein
MNNPFRRLTLSEKLSLLTKDAHEELIQSELTLVAARARVRIAREKLAYLASYPRNNVGLLRPMVPGSDADSGPDSVGMGADNSLPPRRISLAIPPRTR